MTEFVRLVRDVCVGAEKFVYKTVIQFASFLLIYKVLIVDVKMLLKCLRLYIV